MAIHHIAALLVPAWGHTVSYIYLATRMLQKDPTLVITMVQRNVVVAQMETELQTCTYDAARLRIIGVGDTECVTRKEANAQITAGWLENLPQLSEGSEKWPKPHAIHMDFLAGGLVIEPTKKIMGSDCKILMWYSSGLVSMQWLNEFDYAAIAQEIHSEGRRRDRSLDDIQEEVVLASNGSDKLCGRIIKFPGAPDMYDHECTAYAAGPFKELAYLILLGQKFDKTVDGYIVPTAVCFEPVGVPHWREVCHRRGRELFTVGMQAHELCWTDVASPPRNEIVQSFLENAVREYGPKSVLYISFGSLFFPIATPQLIDALVNTLLALEEPFPFIFALGGKLASLPGELIERVNSSGKGLICDFWVEQRAILTHAGVGWFLTHGGFNSASESLSQGIPLIVWPACVEQPVNAAFLAAEPNPVAIELFQVRVGPHLAPSLRGGLKITGTVEDATQEFRAAFDAVRGSKGAVLRANAVKMARALKAARAGEASEEIIRLANFNLPVVA